MCGMRWGCILPCPASAALVMGTPMFDKATLRFSGGRTLVVSRKGTGIYVQKVALDGAEFKSTWLPLAKLHAGTTRLEFTMGTEPNLQRGTAKGDRPPAFR